MQGPCREDLARIYTRSPVKGLYKIMQKGPVPGNFWGPELVDNEVFIVAFAFFFVTFLGKAGGEKQRGKKKLG